MIVAIRKVIGDLRNARTQALLLFAAIVIGQAIMTAAFMAQSVVGREIDRNFLMAKAPDITIEAYGVDGAALRDVEAVPGVAAVDSLAVLSGRYRLSDGSWRQVIVFGRRDFNDLRVSKVFAKGGVWPPRADQVLVERSGLGILQRTIGQSLEISFGKGRRLDLTYAGVVHDPAQAPSWQENTVYGYAPLSTLTTLAAPRPIQFHVRIGPDAKPAIVAKEVSDVLIRRGGRVTRVNTLPAVHPHADLMNGLLLLLSVFSVLAFLAAVFLAGSIIAALAQRQQRHIAVLRSLGASRLRIALMYLAFALTPAIPGLIVGAVAGEAAAGLLQEAIAGQLNIEIADGGPSEALRSALLIAGGAAMLVCVCMPAASSVRRPVREVLQGGLKVLHRPWLRFRILSPMDRLAVAEAFQRPGKTAVTIAALTLGGVALLASSNTFVSLVGLVDRFAASRHDTVAVVMSDRPDPAVLEPGLRAVAGMGRYELWDRKIVSLSARGQMGQFGGQVALYSPPIDTRMGLPALAAGRWPAQPGEIAVSKLSASYNSGLKTAFETGENVVIAVDGKSTTAKIVGLADEWGMSVWASPATFSAVASPNDRSRELRALVDPGRAQAAVAEIERAVIAAGSFPLASTTRDGRREVMVNHFFSFYQFLLVAALSASLVGGAALSANIGSNVLSRTREIGVLRALGADSGALFRLVLVQALAVCLASCALAAALSLPLSGLLNRAIEETALHMLLPLKISWEALAGMTAGACLLATIAAVAPAIRIQRLAIREAIAYE
jgi:putative ABC transport system permease protein